jgi:hypothetical protein
MIVEHKGRFTNKLQIVHIHVAIEDHQFFSSNDKIIFRSSNKYNEMCKF